MITYMHERDNETQVGRRVECAQAKAEEKNAISEGRIAEQTRQ